MKVNSQCGKDDKKFSMNKGGKGYWEALGFLGQRGHRIRTLDVFKLGGQPHTTGSSGTFPRHWDKGVISTAALIHLGFPLPYSAELPEGSLRSTAPMNLRKVKRRTKSLPLRHSVGQGSGKGKLLTNLPMVRAGRGADKQKVLGTRREVQGRLSGQSQLSWILKDAQAGLHQPQGKERLTPRRGDPGIPAASLQM